MAHTLFSVYKVFIRLHIFILTSLWHETERSKLIFPQNKMNCRP